MTTAQVALEVTGLRKAYGKKTAVDGLSLRTAGDGTPLGAAVAALSRSMAGQWPSAAGPGVLAAYAVAFRLPAWRLFRWE